MTSELPIAFDFFSWTLRKLEREEETQGVREMRNNVTVKNPLLTFCALGTSEPHPGHLHEADTTPAACGCHGG